MEPILVEGRNCWRSCKARRVRFLIDAAEYYATFAEAAERAERSIVILGWDVNSQVRLLPEDPRTELGVFFKRLVDEKPGLEIYTLNWNYIALYQKDRERGTAERLGTAAHPRLHYSADRSHPPLGSHHQKVTVIDDRVAFVGGLDFGAARWDTQQHRRDDSRRLNVQGEVAPPFHDVMVMVDDKAAASLGELARERWRQATGELITVAGATADPW
ncbi:MAG: VTT domain-containing protein, partial [Candidatus Binatia bacterium]